MAKKMKSISGTVARQGIVSILLVLVVQVNGNQFFKTFAKGERLSGCLISEKIASNLIDCGQWCLREGCQSLSYAAHDPDDELYTCKLYNNTKKDCLVMMDKRFNYYEMINQVPEKTISNRCPERSISVRFPRHSTEDYVEIDDSPALSAISICAWVKFVKNTNGTILSYATVDSSNEIAIWCYTNEVIFALRGQWIRKKNSLLHDGSWHAICVTWSIVNGHLIVYKDNVVTDEQRDVQTGQNIIKGGRWVLGQDQDHVGGGFEIEDSFQGEMAEVNVWGRVLTRQEITRFSTDCQRRMDGDVKSWPQFITGLRGKVHVVQEPSCTKCKFGVWY